LQIHFLKSSLRIVLMATFAATLFAVPFRAAAQTQNAPSSPAASAPADNASAAPAPKSEKQQEEEFLHAPIVQTLARTLHLPLDTTMWIFLGINFAIIFFAIVIPLGRMMPKLFRKRSATLSQDLKSAREATADANARLSAVEAKLAGLGEEMRAFRAQIEQEILEDEKRIKASIGEESARIVAAAEQEISVAAAQATRGLRTFAADLAIEQAAKQLTLTPDTDRALIAELVNGVGSDGAGKGGNS
jgi:F-type H+-transporting ATPase subunit b